MIAASLGQVVDQVKLTPALEKGLQFLQGTDLRALPDGRVDIDGSQVYALVQSYETIPLETARFEAHRKYLDIQMVVEGVEIIGWAPIERMLEPTPYNETKDVFNGKVPLEEMSHVQLAAGELAVLYPSDAHAPKLMAGQPCRVKKVVVKVGVE